MSSRADYIITYDISDEKRLVKIAKMIEKQAFRVQRSVYIYPDATVKELSCLVQNVVSLIHKDRDDLRVYKISKGNISLGSAIDLDNPDIFLM